MKRLAFVLSCGVLSLWACGSDESANNNNHSYTAMESAVADCDLDVLTFKLADGTLHEVSVNGLDVEAMNGAIKVSTDQWDVTQRRGVRFSEVLTRGSLAAVDATPVNCVARDGWDPLRTQLASDTSKLPEFDFMRDHGYVYVGSPGDKDPMYPEMEGKSLLVDYDMSGDADVPAYLGGNLSGLGKFRYKMTEKVDADHKGVFEIGPVI